MWNLYAPWNQRQQQWSCNAGESQKSKIQSVTTPSEIQGQTTTKISSETQTKLANRILTTAIKCRNLEL
jgi:hypothetical protein